MEISEVIKGRRSVRKYAAQPLEDGVVEELLDAARWAPSWANLQCTRFIVVRDQRTKERLVEAMSPRNPARNAVAGAPVVVVFVGKIDASGHKDGRPVDDKAWYMFDVGLAMQNFCLAAHATGLGTVIVGSFDYGKADEIVNVPEGYQVVAFTPLGYPEGESKAPPRKEISEVVFPEKM